MEISDIKILCVDDSKMVHKFLHGILKKSYKNLYFANDGFDGLEKYKKYTPDIVISDINMPRMDGFEMVAKIQAINSKAIIVMMTTESGSSFAIKAAKEGVSGYINKSNARDEVKSTIDKLAKVIVEQSNLPKSESNDYAYLQPFLELSQEMSILTDGVNIFSSNKIFLDFLEVDSIYDFVANYASIEYLVESVEGIDDKKLNSKHWISFLLDSSEGKEITILNYKSSKRETLIARAAKVPNEKDLYAIIFSQKKTNVSNITQETPNIGIFNFFTQTLSQEYFNSQLPLFLENNKNHDITITMISLRIASIEKANAQRDEIIKIVDILSQKLLAKDLLFSYKQGFLIVCIDSDIATTKAKAKIFADKIKEFYAPTKVRAKIGFVGLNATQSLDKEESKIETYLQRFHEEKFS